MPRPRKMEIHEEALHVEWPDGHHSVYPLDGLRAVCPCVECAGGHAGMGRPVNPRELLEAPQEGIGIRGMEEVGNYAVQFLWTDGHSTGIYSWQFLRQICPCPEDLERS